MLEVQACCKTCKVYGTGNKSNNNLLTFGFHVFSTLIVPWVSEIFSREQRTKILHFASAPQGL